MPSPKTRTQPTENGVEARGGPARLVVTGDVPFRCEDGSIRSGFQVAAGQTVEIRLGYARAQAFG